MVQTSSRTGSKNVSFKISPQDSKLLEAFVARTGYDISVVARAFFRIGLSQRVDMSLEKACLDLYRLGRLENTISRFDPSGSVSAERKMPLPLQTTKRKRPSRRTTNTEAG